jgi:hypothetical protein
MFYGLGAVLFLTLIVSIVWGILSIREGEGLDIIDSHLGSMPLFQWRRTWVG